MKKQLQKTILIAVVAFFGLSNIANAQALFKDLYLGGPTSSSNPLRFTEVNGMMYFVTEQNPLTDYSGTQPHSYALWKSDGTVPNTIRVKDSIISTNAGDALWLYNVNNTLFFVKFTTANIYQSTTTELWKSDGTEAGTTLIKTLLSVNTAPANFTVAGNKLFFQMDAGDGIELWVSDGTTAGTMQVIDLAPGLDPYYSAPISGVVDAPMAAFNGKVYFSGTTVSQDNNGNSNLELYVSDGTSIGTTLVQDINPGIYSSLPKNWVIYNNELYFLVQDSYISGSTTTNIWKTDGTNTVAVTTNNIYHFNTPVVFKNAIYFIKGSTGSEALWKTDGTNAGTVSVTTSAAQINGANADYLITSSYGSNYKKTDGTTVTAVPDSLGKTASFKVLNNKMYYGDGARGLWSTDGTEVGTTHLAPSSLNPNYLFVFDNNLFFSGFIAGTGIELCSLNPAITTGINQVNNLQGISVYPNPSTGIFTCIAPAMSEIKIYNVLGAVVYTGKITSEKTEINLTQQPKGVYFYQLTGNEHAAKSGRIIIE
ncbi:MAG: T9SS type A sorting domain-containing protein [Bacteroidota bacterium]